MDKKEALKEFRAWRKVMRDTHTERVYGEVFDTIERLASRGEWHNAKTEKPVPDEMCYLRIVGTDVIRCKKGETLEQALERSRNVVSYGFGYFEEMDECWCDSEGFPMIVRPSEYMYLKDFYAEV